MGVFDFDETLKICNQNIPSCQAPGGQEVLDLCRADGFGIAIATASCEYDFVKNFLKDRYGFGENFFQTNCFTRCNGLPETSENYKCMVLFDDNDANRQATDFTGAHFIKLDPNTGVTKEKYYEAKNMLEQHCTQHLGRVADQSQ